MKIVLIALSMFLMSGCIAVKPTITEYKINTESIKRVPIIANECKDKTLRISQAFSQSSLMSHKMCYTEFQNRVYSYTQSQWQETPNNFLTQELLKNMRDSNLFKTVLSSKSRSKSDLILESSIDEFMQYYSDDAKKLHVDVAITLTLIDAKDATVKSTQTFTSKLDAKTADAAGGVEAINRALEEIFSKNIEWIEGVCR